jgi:hypothetical protein
MQRSLHKAHTSRYITPEGRSVLSEELSYLWKVKRPQVTQAVAEAAAMGDRSENAEYIYGKSSYDRSTPGSAISPRDWTS